MPFPKANRVIYKKNPLDRVICQLRFSPILKIESAVPAEFQDCIRHAFPEYQCKEEPSVSFGKRGSQDLALSLLKQAVPPTNNNHEFTADDGTKKVNLTKNFLAFTTTNYIKWEDFRKRLEIPLKALLNTYNPPNFSRVGLRYVDLIKRSELGLVDAPWDELLQSFALGLLSEPNVKDSIDSLETKYEVRLEDKQSIARIIMSLVECDESSERCFIVDTDFFCNTKTAPEEAIQKLEYFHVRASRLIQWLIKRRLHNAMEPEEL